MPQETKKTLIQSIGEIQQDLSLYLEKNQTMQMNGRIMYNYFGEAQVLELVKKEFKKHHITYIWSYVKDTLKVINDIPYFEMELTLCKETEEIKTYWPFTGKNTDPAKSIGSALTYGIKYVLSKLLGLPTEELDPDSTEVSKINSKQEKEQKEIINNSNQKWMSEQHFNNIKDFITNKKVEQNIISAGKNWLREKLNVPKLSPVLIRKQSEDFYHKFKERFFIIMIRIGIDPSGTGTTAIVVFENNKLIEKLEFTNKYWKEHYEFINDKLFDYEEKAELIININIEDCLYTSANGSKDRDDLLKLVGSLDIYGHFINWILPKYTKSVVKNMENLSKYNNNCIQEFIDTMPLTYEYGKGWKYNNEKISNHLRDAIIIANYESK